MSNIIIQNMTIKIIITIFVLLIHITLLSNAKTTSNIKIPQTNLLFIIFDDLRPELSIYGRKHMITPNFERLANRSVIFDLAYTQIAVCNPARDSLLTGLRPDTTGTYGFQNTFYPNMIIPTHLVRSGYNTAGIGKVLHWDGNDKEIWNYHSFENGW
jgi:arylsulfatase A-like enzyme